MRGPRLAATALGTARMAMRSSAVKPPSGPMRIAAGAGTRGQRLARGSPPASSAKMRARPAGQSRSSAARLTGSSTVGSAVRPHCSAASTIWARRRSRLSLSTMVRRVTTGTSRATPSSQAFSATQSMRPRFNGAAQSHKSGTISCGADCSTATKVTIFLPTLPTRAAHSPALPLNRRTRSPGWRRMTLPR